MLAVQLAAGRACPQPRLKNKGARATFQWKISGDGPDALRDGYLAPTINHKRQRKALQQPPRDRGDEVGRDNEEQSDGDSHSPQTLSSLPSPLFSVVLGGGFPPSISQLIGFAVFDLSCTGIAER